MYLRKVAAESGAPRPWKSFTTSRLVTPCERSCSRRSRSAVVSRKGIRWTTLGIIYSTVDTQNTRWTKVRQCARNWGVPPRDPPDALQVKEAPGSARRPLSAAQAWLPARAPAGLDLDHGLGHSARTARAQPVRTRSEA